ncbi:MULTISPECIES: histidine kinase famiy protein [unclassified Acidovorax]|uniref:histidine kinase famiy protein n=2 Tax=Acidovorax TaxID=12916 RepID=UPI002882FE98|nr:MULTISPECIES: histidine kinase famiy protein [unclassified Acidovorax]
MNSQGEKPPIVGSKAPEVSMAGSDVRTLNHHEDDIFFTAIETTRMPMLVTDPRQPDQPIVFVNRAFLSMTGYSSEEILGTNCRFLQGPGTDPSTVAALREAIENRVEFTTEILNYRKDGSSFWNALFVSPVYNKQQELVYFFASQLDVSRRRDAEQALAQAQKMEALGQLTGGISHDFNNLLQVISGHLEIAKRRVQTGKDAEAVLTSVGSASEAVKRAATLTQQLLAFARKQRLEGRPINLNAAAQNIRSLIEETLTGQIQLVMELHPDLGNCQVDLTQLEVAIINIVANARDAMPDGGHVTIHTDNVEVKGADLITHGGLQPGTYVTLSITDTGEGIPPELMKQVVNPFFTTKPEGEGTGLGLSMVYGFAKQSGGTVNIYSEVGVGTTVRLYFPATSKAMQLPPTGQDDRPAERGGTERVLVVDDRQEVADLAGAMLENLGYAVEIVTSGAEALARLDAPHPSPAPDLVFSDVLMPGGMNGFVLAREVRRRHPRIALLLTTGYSGDGNITDVSEGAEFDVLKKPYAMGDLARRVRMALDGHSAARAAVHHS